ncbi:hypothetical protein GN958_ATG10033 [Phytophthora infestans]|uniref:Uncharacterized protein n=1 Tax=Phytophthora infestans TaxID=4787 RepID=A0A8S9UIG2_PHYIN|nr:hypothetical protein GN958_ATG10033 [Phytophthora infestans]
MQRLSLTKSKVSSIESEEKVSADLAKNTTKPTHPDKKLYMKPSQHAKQARLVPLSNETRPPGRRRQTLDIRRTICRAPADLCGKNVRQGILRATASRVAEAAEVIDAYLTIYLERTEQLAKRTSPMMQALLYRRAQRFVRCSPLPLNVMSAACNENNREEGDRGTRTLLLTSKRFEQYSSRQTTA